MIAATIRQVLSSIARVRDAALDRVVEVNGVTERAVMATGEILQRITLRATNHVERLQSLRAHSEQRGTEGLNAAVQRQLDGATTYSHEIGGLIAQQNVQAREALGELEVIRSAALQIERLAKAARTLALNAQIEAMRLGEAGKPFGVVAAEMKLMAQQVEHANTLVGRTAESLQASLPQLASRSEEMDARSKSFAVELGERLRDVTGEGESLRRAIQEALTTGDEALGAVLADCREAFSQLQFQDPAAQQLLMIDQDAYALQRELCELLEVEDEELRPPPLAPLSGQVSIEQVRNGEAVLF